MPFYKSFSEDTELDNVYRFEWRIWKDFGEFSAEVMRGPSPLSPGERELIAGFVSGLNGCEYCRAAHTAAAVASGFPDTLMPQLLDNIATAAIDRKLKPILAYVRKLNLSPTKVTEADAKAVFAAGWDEVALHHAIAVTARYNLVNRLIHGHGGEANPDTFRESASPGARKPRSGRKDQ